MYDDTTGLIYLGSGQYYDPATGRMLTRGAGQSNPYKPGAFDPAGMMVAPLGLLGLVLGKKKKRGKWDSLLVLLVVGVVVGMSVSACNQPASPEGEDAEPTVTIYVPTPTKTATPPPTATVTPTMETTDETVVDDVNYPCELYNAPTATITPYDILDESKLRGDKPEINTGTNGKEYYEWYKELWRNKSWWWWKTHTSFTVWDFITLILHLEIDLVGRPNSSLHKGYPDYKEGLVRQSYAWCAYVYPHEFPNTREGALNWLAGYSQSVKDLVKLKSPIDLKNVDQLKYAGFIVDALRQPIDPVTGEDWSKGYSKHEPYGVGNISMFQDTVEKQKRLNYVLNHPEFLSYRSGPETGDEIIVPTGCGANLLYGERDTFVSVKCDGLGNWPWD